MKDIIYVESHTYTTASNFSLIFRNVITKKEKKIPFTDVDYIIFDHPRSYFSTKLILKCRENRIGVLFCNEKHIPVSTLYPEYNYYQKLERLQQQIKLPQRVKDRLWRKIIKAKITNQASYKQLKSLEKEVQSNDKTYKESHASRIYFSALFGEKFRRGRYNDSINSALNYTYAILRALIRKQLCAHGFEPSLGIKHQSKENPFNLADDIIEAYRPIVDLHVYTTVVENQITEIDSMVKKKLVQVLFKQCIIEKRIHYVSDAIKLTVSSLISCYKNHTIMDTHLPRLIEGGV